MNKFAVLIALMGLLSGTTLLFAGEKTSLPPEVPVKGMVTMLDLGAARCLPCKMMTPIIEELEKEYEGKAAILFIDVWKHLDQTEKYRLKAIPTQIFYDKNGKEVYRHEGFMDKKSIEAMFEKLGVKK